MSAELITIIIVCLVSVCLAVAAWISDLPWHPGGGGHHWPIFCPTCKEREEAHRGR